MNDVLQIQIPESLLPTDKRFGCGPSKVRQASLDNLIAVAPSYMGTSHRKQTVRAVVERLQDGLRSLYSLPDDYEVALGNGGTTVFWDVLAFGLIERKAQHLAFGEFSAKFATVTERAPFLDAPEVLTAEPGTHPDAVARDDVDTYALTHNETSTGVAMNIERVGDDNTVVAVDATSAAGGLRVDITQTDCYYFAPQKCFGSDGGLWVAFMSPRAIERVGAIEASGRWIPESIRISTALENSRLHQTYNTPSLATIFLMLDQVEWMNINGGLEWAASRCDRSADMIYRWAQGSSFATPFVGKPDERSHVVATIDIDNAIDADMLCAALRANGILDTESYRKLGRNQMRIALFPGIQTEDIEALTKCIDFIVERLT